MKRLYLELCLKLRTLWRALKLFSGADITAVGRLYATVTHADGTVEELGLICTKLVTTAGVNYLAALMASGSNAMWFHATGTGSTAAAITDTALGTEVETRATGSHTAAANVYTTAGTVSYTGSRAITEHGIFSASSVGTLLDRSVFSAINVVNLDTITFTFTLTFPTGG